jgi:hypothetical protein
VIDIERFIDGYVECALWADCMPPENDPDGEFGGREHLQLREGAREKMSVDCRAFCEANEADLLLYCERCAYDPSQGSVDSYAGHDFWLTRCGHGGGFWDRGLGELGERLTAAAKVYGEPDDHHPYDCGDGTADV